MVYNKINIHQSAFNTVLPLLVFSLGTSLPTPDYTEGVDILLVAIKNKNQNIGKSIQKFRILLNTVNSIYIFGFLQNLFQSISNIRGEY